MLTTAAFAHSIEVTSKQPLVACRGAWCVKRRAHLHAASTPRPVLLPLRRIIPKRDGTRSTMHDFLAAPSCHRYATLAGRGWQSSYLQLVNVSLAPCSWARARGDRRAAQRGEGQLRAAGDAAALARHRLRQPDGRAARRARPLHRAVTHSVRGRLMRHGSRECKGRWRVLADLNPQNYRSRESFLF